MLRVHFLRCTFFKCTRRGLEMGKVDAAAADAAPRGQEAVAGGDPAASKAKLKQQVAKAKKNNTGESPTADGEKAKNSGIPVTAFAKGSLTVNGAVMYRGTEGDSDLQAVQNQAYPNRLVVLAGANTENFYVGGIFLADMRPDNVSSDVDGTKLSDSVRLFDARGWVGVQNDDGSLKADVGVGGSTMPSWDLQGGLLSDTHRSSLLSPQNTKIALGGTPIGPERTVGSLMQTSDGGFDNGVVVNLHADGGKDGVQVDAKLFGMYEISKINSDGTMELTKKHELVLDGKVSLVIPSEDFEFRAVVHGGHTDTNLSGPEQEPDTTVTRIGAGALLRHKDSGIWTMLTAGRHTQHVSFEGLEETLSEVSNFQLRMGVDLDVLPVGATRIGMGYGQYQHDDGDAHTVNLSLSQIIQFSNYLTLEGYAGLQSMLWRPDGEGNSGDPLAEQVTGVAGLKFTGSWDAKGKTVISVDD